MSSALASSGGPPASTNSAYTRARPATIARASPSGMMLCRANIRAWAMLAAMSSSYRRRSTDRELLKASTLALVGLVNRLPHNLVTSHESRVASHELTVGESVLGSCDGSDGA